MGKLSTIFQIFWLTAGLSCASQFFADMILSSGVVAKDTPVAHAWLQSMIKKHPDAGLHTVKMVPVTRSGWSMWHRNDGFACIGCPSEKYSGSKPFTHADELSLLHETGHIRNHQKAQWLWKFGIPTTKITAPLAIACFMAVQGYEMMKSVPHVKDYPAAVSALSAVTVCGLTLGIKRAILPLFQRVDEILADRFACKHADSSALLDGYQKYCHHAQLQQRWYKTFVHRWWDDFAHPASSDRANNIKKTLNNRFGIDPVARDYANIIVRVV